MLYNAWRNCFFLRLTVRMYPDLWNKLGYSWTISILVYRNGLGRGMNWEFLSTIDNSHNCNVLDSIYIVVTFSKKKIENMKVKRIKIKTDDYNICIIQKRKKTGRHLCNGWCSLSEQLVGVNRILESVRCSSSNSKKCVYNSWHGICRAKNSRRNVEFYHFMLSLLCGSVWNSFSFFELI